MLEAYHNTPHFVYLTRLVQLMSLERPSIEHLISHPTDLLHLHVYGARKAELGWKPNVEGYFAIQSLVHLLEEIACYRSKSKLPTVFIAGGHASSYGGNNLCRIYKDSLNSEIAKSLLLANRKVKIIDEQEMNILQWRDSYAVDTRGELRALKRYRENYGYKQAVSIGRLEHLERIRLLARTNHILTQTLSIEGILALIHPEIITNTVLLNTFNLDAQRSFYRSEQKKLRLMSLDRNGFLIEATARLIGHRKRSGFEVLGQEKL